MISPNPFDRSKRSRQRTSYFVPAMLGALVLLVCLAVVLWQRQLGGVLWQAGAPLMRLRNSVVSSEVNTLKAELASSTAALADRNELYAQNIELKKMLGRPQTSQRTVAAVLMRPPGLPYDTLVVDAGTEDGIVAGDLVFAGGGAAIGEVTDAYAAVSRVSLFSAPGRTYEAQVAPASAAGKVIPLTLKGQGAGSFSGEVPAGSQVVVGDPIVLPGLGSAFMGTVSHVDAPSGSSFETVFVQMPVSIFSLHYVQIQTRI